MLPRNPKSGGLVLVAIVVQGDGRMGASVGAMDAV